MSTTTRDLEDLSPFGYGDRSPANDIDGTDPKSAVALGPDVTPWELAADVNDPEIPALSIADLGILRAVEVSDDGGTVTVTITPTYSGCPAMKAIEHDLRRVFTEAGYREVVVDVVLAPAWTTDWITPRGLAALEESGIAPPTGTRAVAGPVSVGLSVRCPHCGDFDTEVLSQFGSTSCKALYRCNTCREPFDWFKTLR
ncbi:ring-1,2-phenylacetyl-CoA epoxidase subunit PaaD [Antricoccus suffuscus]|uniref:Ring-1,2-phenylacetyl-CoA epoxidase subunit PaaD n=1 Tax=Antricoccus suffuscus TaxID=1629062 RepID=A0A2T1A6H3_9ACTN|nr:1,2-phenylacetyl-CoA epoxidase subunit PaaD [Antricoccus suffuscus]PRZ44199.1 ring-1,2-phenylacetyl-CoA epoxidase subunit PaaD [Antricoccus suffuscus]